MNIQDTNEPLLVETLEEWVMDKAREWKDHYRQNYQSKHEEYYRIFKGIWAAEDKTKETERSKIIAPATQQAVESNVAEIEEATFGRGEWFDITDDNKDPNPQDVGLLKRQLSEAFKITKIRKQFSGALLNGAIYGTGIGEVPLESMVELRPATEPVMDGQLRAVGVQKTDRTVVKLKPVKPQNFFIDPLATCIEDAMGCGTDEFVSKHYITQMQEKGVFESVPINQAPDDLNLEPDRELMVYRSDNKVRLTKYYGLVPTHLLPKDEQGEGSYTEAMVIIANEDKRLKGVKNPFMMQDRPMLAFQWDSDPSKFWGIGVVEKAYNSQKALDAELRARIDALALTVHPMMGLDATRVPRGFRPVIRSGQTLLTNGNPEEVLKPFKFGSVDQITFAQAGALQDMVQQATGAVDTAGLAGVISGEAKAGAVSMSLGAIIKRQKRTLLNFQESFLIPFVEKAAYRYMQYDPENFPVKDYKFTASSSLGIIAREYEVTQLVQLLNTMGQDTPMYAALVESIVENMNLSNRENILQAIRKSQEPNPEQQKVQQVQLEKEMELKDSQIGLYKAQSAENNAQALKYSTEARLYPTKLEIDKLKAASGNLEKGIEDDKEFDRRLKIAELHLKEKAMNNKAANEAQVLQRITANGQPNTSTE